MNENRTSNHRRPRRMLFASPAADAVWAAICALDPATQHDVLRDLQDRLGAAALSASDVREQRTVAALREAAELLGRWPSVDDFRRLRLENQRAGWPPDSTVRRWLGGSWNDCLKRAHLDPCPTATRSSVSSARASRLMTRSARSGSARRHWASCRA